MLAGSLLFVLGFSIVFVSYGVLFGVAGLCALAGAVTVLPIRGVR